MKANNTTPNVSDLARWIDLQLSTITEGVSSGYTLGDYTSVWIDKGSTVFNVSLANGETVEIDSDNYSTAEEIANAIISTLNNTPATMTASEIIASLNEKQVRTAAARLLPGKFFDEHFTPERGNIALLRQILEDHVFEYDTTASEIMEAAGAGENTNETKAPEFSQLSHAATNIVLAAESTRGIYTSHVEPLLRSLEHKAAKGATLLLDTLAKSYAMAAIIRESIKEIKRTSYDSFSVNADDRHAAALYLANLYIGEL